MVFGAESGSEDEASYVIMVRSISGWDFIEPGSGGCRVCLQRMATLTGEEEESAAREKPCF